MTKLNKLKTHSKVAIKTITPKIKTVPYFVEWFTQRIRGGKSILYILTITAAIIALLFACYTPYLGPVGVIVTYIIAGFGVGAFFNFPDSKVQALVMSIAMVCIFAVASLFEPLLLAFFIVGSLEVVATTEEQYLLNSISAIAA